MTEPSIIIHQQLPLPEVATAVAVCCREWTIALGHPLSRCGYCNERPKVRFTPEAGVA